MWYVHFGIAFFILFMSFGILHINLDEAKFFLGIPIWDHWFPWVFSTVLALIYAFRKTSKSQATSAEEASGGNKSPSGSKSKVKASAPLKRYKVKCRLKKRGGWVKGHSKAKKIAAPLSMTDIYIEARTKKEAREKFGKGTMTSSHTIVSIEEV